MLFVDKSGLTHWITESGGFEVYFFVGENVKAIQRTIHSLMGGPQVPPLFSLGYHQCRWNYKNVADVLAVQDKFDENDMPVDVIWLDIEHTDGKRYMTWHPKEFADSGKMLAEVSARGRKMVTIVDPHLKKDPEWPVYSSLIESDLAVKAADGKSNFEGNCWPGTSVWTDYTNPKARDWWAELFNFSNYKVRRRRGLKQVTLFTETSFRRIQRKTCTFGMT